MGALDILLTATWAVCVSILLHMAWKRLSKRTGPGPEVEARLVRQLDLQLPGLMEALASSLSSGNSLLQSLDAVGGKLRRPMSDHVHRIVIQVKAGMPLDLALEQSTAGMGGGAMALAFHSMAASYRSGSNMVESLGLLAQLCRDRENLREKIHAGTAQSRMQGTVLILVPYLFLLFLFIASPQNIVPVLRSPVGKAILALVALLQTTGTLVIRRMLKQEILG
ncbi:MAG: type II secretion system F family protein [bacterium]|nr:MAG: type II secretion system F family protein [bacterium]